VQLQSKLTGKSLRVLESGLLDCTVGKGTACEFTVAGGTNSALKFRNVAQPQYYLAIVNGYTVGYVSCNPVRGFTTELLLTSGPRRYRL
jgi:hypothetical protein